MLDLEYLNIFYTSYFHSPAEMELHSVGLVLKFCKFKFTFNPISI